MAEIVERFFEGLGDFVVDVAQVDVHEGFADDGQGEAIHFAVQVAGFAVSPVVRSCGGWNRESRRRSC